MILCAVDAESNGLHGQPFAIGAVVLTDAGRLHDTFTDRCPIDGPVDPWVETNVLPAIEHMPQTSGSYQEMLGHLRTWRGYHAPFPTVAHVAWPVEARLFSDAYGHDPALAFAGPYPLHDLASMLWLAGEVPTAAEAYLKRYGIRLPQGGEHDPLYDAHCTGLAAQHLLNRFAPERATEPDRATEAPGAPR